MSWLLVRAENLKKLKETRETMTYRTERMGGWQHTDAIEDTKMNFPDHLRFQEAILKLLCEAVEGQSWERSYNPTERSRPLRLRFNEYKDLAVLVTGP